MQGFSQHTGLVAPMNRENVDTDQIMPKQFLKRIERTGYGPFAFFDWRYLPDGAPNPEFELNRPQYQGATVLVTGQNFGCGSSREHAPWGLAELGFKVLIAPSFADIFYNNCFKNFMLPVVLPAEQVAKVMRRAESTPGYKLTVDVAAQTISDGDGFSVAFEVDAFRKHCLVNGLDDIGLTLQRASVIAAYEGTRPAYRGA
ncbi:MAG TPA: 3-isopropylmalate dehydratase small subunit [Symbiobacteriaceae bacterium]|jgi:3-isopropylmalate/(R)-2-methylmalate dehydratase small subunit